jgi:hypothetical protein
MEHYPTNTNPTAQSSSPAVSSAPKFSFTARYEVHSRVIMDELTEYFKLPVESFQTCDPINWWYMRRHQFPELHRFALDILSIPGIFNLLSLPGTSVLLN